MNLNWREKAIALSEKTKIFRTFRSEFEIRDSQSAIAVACSGGADSLAALLLTWANFPDARERICVLHYDHAVREESAADAEFVREVCENLGVEFVCERRVPAGNENLGENELRRLRLDFFAREMRSREIKILVQGHQRDDIAETLLMRLTRGAGTDGLAAPRKISRQADGRIFVRPLSDFPKEKILAALRDCEIPWREDATNAGTDYFRNRVRNRVLPELRAAAPFENIARSRKLAEEDADALDFFSEKIMGEATFLSLPQETENARKQVPASHSYKLFSGSNRNVASPLRFPAIARRVLRKIFAREKIETDGAAVADALVEAICAGTPLKTQIGERTIIWDGKILEFRGRSDIPVASSKIPFEDFNEATEKSLLLSEKVEITEALFEQIRAGAFPPTETVFLAGTPDIFVRELFPGEKFRPLGAPGEKSVLRIFTDKKIPAHLRKNLPVFADGTGIAWIPGLPPAERFRIRSAGTTALRLTYRGASLV